MQKIISAHPFSGTLILYGGRRVFGKEAEKELHRQVSAQVMELRRIFSTYKPSDDILGLSLLKIQSEMAIQEVERRQRLLCRMFPVFRL